MGNPDRRLRRCTRVLVALLCAWYGSTSLRAAGGNNLPLVPHVRGTTDDLAGLIAEGQRRSPLFRALVEQLEHSDVVVYVEHGQLRDNLCGRLQFIGGNQPWRYVKVEIDSRHMLLEQIAALGHELQHAVEIAEAPGAASPAFVEQLYRTIGFPMDNGHRSYETDAARKTGRLIYRQLASTPVARIVAEHARTAD